MALPCGVSAGLTKLSARLSGSVSTTMTRGRSLAGRSAKCLRTAAADTLLVSTIFGLESPKTALRCEVWPGSLGS